MTYDTEKKELEIVYNGVTGFVPTVAYYEPINQGQVVTMSAPEPKPMPLKMQKVSAQVSTPMGHVFEGPGAGKTGKDK